MIASVARDSGRTIESVAGDSYALTLYTHLQKQDAEYMASLVREQEAIELAEMIAYAFHEPKKLAQFRRQLMSKLTVPRQATLAELEQHADALWAKHQNAAKKKLVS